jgi:hypothetical protein
MLLMSRARLQVRDAARRRSACRPSRWLCLRQGRLLRIHVLRLCRLCVCFQACRL